MKFRDLSVGDKFVFAVEREGVKLKEGGYLRWSGAVGPWIKTGAKTYKKGGSIYRVGSINAPVILSNPLKSGYSREIVSANIAKLTHEGKPRSVAIAAAYTSARDAWRKAFPRKKLPSHLKKNPIAGHERGELLKQAARLYNDFTGHGEFEVKRVKVPNFPRELVVIGELTHIGYDTVRDGEYEKYMHVFKKSARPLFCVSPDGRQIIIIGGRFQFTDRGIVDK